MNSAIYLVLFSLLVPPSIQQCTVSTALPFFRRSVYQFSMELSSKIAEEKEGHFVSSTFSPYTLLSIMAAGADGQTLDEFNSVLQLHPNKCFNKKFFEIVQALTTQREGTVLKRASAIYFDSNKRVQLNYNFTKYVQQSRVSEFKKENFYYLEDIVNAYVTEVTNGSLDSITLPDLSDAFLVLIDVLYFKGSWKTQFSEAETEPSTFYDINTAQIGDVNLMYGVMQTNMVRIPTIRAQVLELPYKGDRYSMLIFLPDIRVTVRDVLEHMKKIGLNSVFYLFNERGEVTVQVQMPKFKIESELSNMKEWLQDMGLRFMFSSELAEFPKITDDQVYVSDIVQKASIEVNEEGSEASAATAGVFQGRSLIPIKMEEFTANRPFAYMIVDKHLQLPLFVGAYSKPSVL